jgi:hypothetical protein
MRAVILKLIIGVIDAASAPQRGFAAPPLNADAAI